MPPRSRRSLPPEGRVGGFGRPGATDMKTLISAPELMRALAAAHPPVLLDCSFDLADPTAGRRAWQGAHLPGAHYLHLDDDLSGAKTGRNGRHPLPERARLAARLGALGIGPATPVVAYDAQGGPYAARAWWLLLWLGHEDVAVLDGGVAAWRAAGGSVTSQASAAPAEAAPYPLHASAAPTLDAAAVRASLGRHTLVDARAPERFRGEVEPLDRAAGHIPGARNRFFKDNLGADGRFKDRATLRAEWQPLAATGPLVHYCGSGVTACHNLLAAAHAGLGLGTLYPGSWSEWSSDPALPQAQG
jgi:thiosulfate/3-mercaptopyruvate sulfurtransferase